MNMRAIIEDALGAANVADDRVMWHPVHSEILVITLDGDQGMLARLSYWLGGRAAEVDPSYRLGVRDRALKIIQSYAGNDHVITFYVKDALVELA